MLLSLNGRNMFTLYLQCLPTLSCVKISDGRIFSGFRGLLETDRISARTPVSCILGNPTLAIRLRVGRIKNYNIGRATHRFTLEVLLIIRPPVRSNGRSYKMLVMFLFFRRQISELPWPIAAKLCHMIGTCVNFIN